MLCRSHDSPGRRRRTGGCFDASFVLVGPTHGFVGDPVGVARGRGSCSHFWTTSLRWRFLRESVQCMLPCKNIYGAFTVSECTQARRRCGTGKVSDPMLAMCWNALLWQQIPMHGCGGSGDTDLPEAQQGMKVLGTPLGHPSFVEAHLQKKLTEQRTCLERIPEEQDLQSAWSLLVHCASARANYLLQVVEPQSVANFARSHGMWRCLCRMTRIDVVQEEHIRSAPGMPLVLGSLGLRSAVRLSKSAFWASWADCLPMVFSRHRDVAIRFVVNLGKASQTLRRWELLLLPCGRSQEPQVCLTSSSTV